VRFTPHDYRRRVGLLREALPTLDAEWALVGTRPDIRYLTGFTGSAGVVLVGLDRVILITDGRYDSAARSQTTDVEVRIDRDWVGLLGQIVGDAPLAVDRTWVTMHTYGQLEAAGVRVRPAEPLVPRIRMVKEGGERERIHEACRIADEAFAIVARGIRVGVTERQIGRWLRDTMLDLGADDIAFPPIVAAGVNGAQPHHVPDDTAVASGDLVTLDFGALIDGYHSDMTRTVAIGRVADWQIEVVGVVTEAQAAARRACRPALSLAELDAVARDLIAAAGFGACYPHGLGHGVGLEIHEAPMIGPRSMGMVTADTPITIEPGIYLPGRGGVRIEDTVWVGSVETETLTGAPRELLTLG
jgi:Xaa-Pro aminopeptidase